MEGTHGPTALYFIRGLGVPRTHRGQLNWKAGRRRVAGPDDRAPDDRAPADTFKLVLRKPDDRAPADTSTRFTCNHGVFIGESPESKLTYTLAADSAALACHATEESVADVLLCCAQTQFDGINRSSRPQP